ncbi:hypothetical protein EV196_105176 [Mariniflexile fucanivorans]|uniref:Uncharacterized protein n=1 Tax=Mariniflexile fucanivorans TaxID=264023 RepID=A0A4R1RHG4_9FLAO|nr:hypothetical protein [Mariniflexile fucanivorans]TCL65515.1 hypothetical protein EV196_105176 [Mariniflexile fucanivorans]
MKINKNILFLLILISSNILFSQKFSYHWDKETGEITSFDKHIFEFKNTYIYDMDFEKKGETYPVDFVLLIEKKDRNTNGRLVTMWDNKKTSIKILNCFEKTYLNSTDKYFTIKCENLKGGIMYFNLDYQSSWRLWIDKGENERIYFLK